MLYLVAVCLLPIAAYGGERTEQRWLYQHSDGEWFKCKGKVCDQPIPPPAGGAALASSILYESSHQLKPRPPQRRLRRTRQTAAM